MKTGLSLSCTGWRSSQGAPATLTLLSLSPC